MYQSNLFSYPTPSGLNHSRLAWQSRDENRADDGISFFSSAGCLPPLVKAVAPLVKAILGAYPVVVVVVVLYRAPSIDK